MVALLTLNKKQMKNVEHSRKWDVAVATLKHDLGHGMSHHVRNDFLFVIQRGIRNDSS